MRRYTRRLFGQAICGAIVCLPIANPVLRGDDPPRPLIDAKICVIAQGIDKNGNLCKSDEYCHEFNPSVKSCASVYLELDATAVKNLTDKCSKLEVYWVVVTASTGCPDVVVDPQPEESFRDKTGKQSCLKPRWQAIVTCVQCDGGHRRGIGYGLTKAGARIRAQRDLENKLCLAKTRCKTKKRWVVSRVNLTSACCD